MVLGHPDETKLTYASGIPGHLLGTVRDDVYRLLRADSLGRMCTDADRTAFGEAAVAEPTPLVALNFAYNVNSILVESRENNAGTLTQAANMAVLQSGASANSAAHLLSNRAARYQPGQGVVVRLTALFTTGVADSVQLAGLAEVGDGLMFGFNGATFSILRRHDGGPEVQTLTVSAAADTAGGTITIALDGVDTEVELDINDTTREIAVKIAATDFSDVGLGWKATVHNATVIFQAWSAGNKTGAFTLTDTDTTGAAGTFAETIAGVATTNQWIAQADWNVDTMLDLTIPGNESKLNPSGMTLDPTQINVFQIRFQWLGAGDIYFFIEDKETGLAQLVHVIKYAGANTTTSLQNPTLPLHAMAKNNANTSNLTVKVGSMGAFVEGRESFESIHHGDSNRSALVTTAELPIISIKSNVVFQSKVNRVRALIGLMDLVTDGTKGQVFRLRVDGTLTGPVAFTDVDANTSVVSVDKGATGVTGGRVIATFGLGKADSQPLDLHALAAKLGPGNILTVTAEADSGSGHTATVSTTWAELF